MIIYISNWTIIRDTYYRQSFLRPINNIAELSRIVPLVPPRFRRVIKCNMTNARDYNGYVRPASDVMNAR